MLTPATLDTVIVALGSRGGARAPDYAAENAALVWLTDELAQRPQEIFRRLVDVAMSLTRAQSAGISLLDAEGKAFVWPAVAGAWSGLVGNTIPRDFSPCGTVLDRDAAVLFQRPERYFSYIAGVTPVIDEGLLVPFHVDGCAVGTVWTIKHPGGGAFDREDERLLTSLSKFTAAAYRTLSEIGALDALR